MVVPLVPLRHGQEEHPGDKRPFRLDPKGWKVLGSEDEATSQPLGRLERCGSSEEKECSRGQGLFHRMARGSRAMRV